MSVVVFSRDLGDRSRLAALGARVARAPEDAAGADVVVVDLARFADQLERIRSVAPNARIVAYGPHVDTEAADRAREHADVVVPRSRFFRDPGAHLGGV